MPADEVRIKKEIERRMGFYQFDIAVRNALYDRWESFIHLAELQAAASSRKLASGDAQQLVDALKRVGVRRLPLDPIDFRSPIVSLSGAIKGRMRHTAYDYDATMYDGMLPAPLVSQLRATPGWDDFDTAFLEAYQLTDDPEIRELLVVPQ